MRGKLCGLETAIGTLTELPIFLLCSFQYFSSHQLSRKGMLPSNHSLFGLQTTGNMVFGIADSNDSPSLFPIIF